MGASSDHPRSRGEYSCEIRFLDAPDGSSPLSRGIPHSAALSAPGEGIIPALAGNTRCRHRNRPEEPDHPRSRGEYNSRTSRTSRSTGSSPLSRGIPGGVLNMHDYIGIIPALAGNTTYPSRRRTATTDHPRSRGEYSRPLGMGVPNPGSSPLSRGILSGVTIPGRRRRIIPALAGNTLVDKGFYQPDLSDLGNPLLARLRFSKSLAPRLRRPPSWRGGSSGSASEGPGRTIRVSPS